MAKKESVEEVVSEVEVNLNDHYIILRDDLLIEFQRASESSKGGVIIPEMYRKDDKGTGIIKLVGPDCKYPFKVGQRVAVKGSGSIINIANKEYAQIPEYNVMGILK